MDGQGRMRASNGDHLEGDGKENPMHVVANNGDHFEEMCLAVAGGGTGGQHGPRWRDPQMRMARFLRHAEGCPRLRLSLLLCVL